jgi:hypothetical protein
MAISEFGKGAISFGLQQVANTVGGNTALKRQERLMGINLKNQKELNRQGRDIQMDMWNRTNYGAQVRHMKEAGLSPGLIYGNSGGGGATTGSQGGGSAASGGAPSRPQMGMEALLMGEQMNLMKAQARKLNVDANKIEGADTDLAIAQKLKTDKETAKLIQEKTNLKTIDEINKFEKAIKKAEKDRTDKGMIKGDNFGNLLNAIGLDPVNNPTDRVILNGMLGTWFGSKIANNIMQAIMSWKGPKTNKKGFNQPDLKEVKKGANRPFNHIEWSVE